MVGGGSLEQGLGGSERKGLESPAEGAGPGPDGRPSGLGYYWTLRCYLPHLPTSQTNNTLASATSPQMLGPWYSQPRWCLLLWDLLEVVAAPQVLQRNNWVLAGVKRALDTNGLPSSEPFINPFLSLFPQASLPRLLSEPAEGEGRLRRGPGKPAPGLLLASSRGRAHGIVSRRGSPARRGGARPPPRPMCPRL